MGISWGSNGDFPNFSGFLDPHGGMAPLGPDVTDQCPYWGCPLIGDLQQTNYPLVNIQIAMENGHRNSGFSH